MRPIFLAIVLLVAAVSDATFGVAPAADVVSVRVVRRAPHWQRAPYWQRPPLALRTLTGHSVGVLAATPCWRACTTECGWHTQACLRVDRQDFCLAANNQCELTCLKACRLSGGPLVSWTDY